jgi:gluconokinase
MGPRTDHFFSAELLDSQLATLEPPNGAIEIDIEAEPDQIVETIVKSLR